jgi:hypothetical protein
MEGAMLDLRLVRSMIVLLLGSLLAIQAHAAPEDLEFFSDFENLNPNTAVGEIFDVGLAPDVGSFGGDAFGGRVGNPALYRSGVRSWMVVPAGVGTIEFPTLAGVVEFHAVVLNSATGDTVISAFDALDQQVGPSVTIEPGTGFQLVRFVGKVAAIDIENFDAVQLNGIDDFGFTSLPEPGLVPMAMAGTILLVHLRRREAPSGRRRHD